MRFFRTRYSKVSKLYCCSWRNKYIARLNVSVHDSFGMRIFKRIARIKKNKKRKLCSKRDLFFNHFIERHSVDKFLNYIVRISFDKIIIQMNNVRTLQIKKNLSFPLETFSHSLVVSYGQFFEYYKTLERRMNCFIHSTHSAFCNKSHNSVFTNIIGNFLCHSKQPPLKTMLYRSTEYISVSGSNIFSGNTTAIFSCSGL